MTRGARFSPSVVPRFVVRSALFRPPPGCFLNARARARPQFSGLRRPPIGCAPNAIANPVRKSDTVFRRGRSWFQPRAQLQPRSFHARAHHPCVFQTFYGNHEPVIGVRRRLRRRACHWRAVRDHLRAARHHTMAAEYPDLWLAPHRLHAPNLPNPLLQARRHRSVIMPVLSSIVRTVVVGRCVGRECGWLTVFRSCVELRTCRRSFRETFEARTRRRGFEYRLSTAFGIVRKRNHVQRRPGIRRR